KASSTFARYTPSADVREIDPAGFGDPPKDPLTAARFFDSLPSPGISVNRLEFVRSPDRPGLIRLSPITPPASERPRQPESPSSQPVTQAMPPAPPVRRPVVQQPVVMAPAPEPIVETYYLAPIFTGIIVMNPPEKKPPKPRHPPAPAASVMPPQPAEPDT